MDKIIMLIKKHWDIISYLFFGVLTTVVDYIVSFICHYQFGMSPTVSTALAWAAAVIFAYLTNKQWVFGSKDWSMKTILPESFKFVGSRVFSGVLTIGLTKILDMLGIQFVIIKLSVSIINIVLNYIASKLLVFAKKKDA